MSVSRKHLYALAQEWEDQSGHDPRDFYYFRGILDEVLFHADTRYHEYVQHREEGEFPSRLDRWLKNLPDDRERKTLFRMLPSITFIDRVQMMSLQKDAFRRVIVPWLTAGSFSQDALLASDYDARILSLLREYALFSITESFGHSDFLHVNNLTGLRKPKILGEGQPSTGVLPHRDQPLKGLIILEDFVGTGSQARRVIAAIRQSVLRRWRILFVPLILLNQGQQNMAKDKRLRGVDVRPVLVIPDECCLKESAKKGEGAEFSKFRALVKSTARRVLESSGVLDDPPLDAFGYGGSGALVVTCHNTPNNTLPLIHHRSPSWSPLFRRIHHQSKDGLR